MQGQIRWKFLRLWVPTGEIPFLGCHGWFWSLPRVSLEQSGCVFTQVGLPWINTFPQILHGSRAWQCDSYSGWPVKSPQGWHALFLWNQRGQELRISEIKKTKCERSKLCFGSAGFARLLIVLIVLLKNYGESLRTFLAALVNVQKPRPGFLRQASPWAGILGSFTWCGLDFKGFIMKCCLHSY